MSDFIVGIFQSEDYQACIERQLVLEARGINSQIVALETGYALHVPLSIANRAISEIIAYIEENQPHIMDQGVYAPRHLDAKPALFGYPLVLYLITLAEAHHWLGLDWYSRGRVDGGLFFDGQWWRVITALTLHADITHLAGNLGFGLILGLVAARYFGYGLASVGILLAGALGNTLNLMLRGTEHFSIGASTAVFAALGLISCYAWLMRFYPQRRWAVRLGPILAGTVLLAFTGTGGERTDIGAHLFGFLSGCGLGFILSRFEQNLPLHRKAQRVYASMALALLTFAWLLALYSV